MQPKKTFIDFRNPLLIKKVTFEVDKDLYTIQRKSFTLLACLGEIGGLSKSAKITMQILLPLFQLYTLERFLISQLYSRSSPLVSRRARDIKSDDVDQMFKTGLVALSARSNLKNSAKPKVTEGIRLLLGYCCKKF
jgi:hypothetical protein